MGNWANAVKVSLKKKVPFLWQLGLALVNWVWRVQPVADGADVHLAEERAADRAGTRWHYGKKGHGLCEHKGWNTFMPRSGLFPSATTCPASPAESRFVACSVLAVIRCCCSTSFMKDTYSNRSQSHLKHWQNLSGSILQCLTSCAFPCAFLKVCTDP